VSEQLRHTEQRLVHTQKALTRASKWVSNGVASEAELADPEEAIAATPQKAEEAGEADKEESPSEATQRGAPQDNKSKQGAASECEDHGDDAAMVPRKIERRNPPPPPPPYISLQWAFDIVVTWLGNQSVALHVKLGVATIAAAAAIWLCRGVFLMCRGVSKWGKLSSSKILGSAGGAISTLQTA